MDWTKAIIGAVIMLIVILISVGGFTKLYAAIAGPLLKSFDDQNESYKAFVNENFNKFVENLKTCAAIKNNTCLCKNVLPNLTNFPPEKIKIKIKPSTPQSGVTLFFKEQEVKKEVVNAFITIADIEKVFEISIEHEKKDNAKTNFGTIYSQDVYKSYVNRIEIVTVETLLTAGTPKAERERIEKLKECK